jgi:hypothetical protein
VRTKVRFRFAQRRRGIAVFKLGGAIEPKPGKQRRFQRQRRASAVHLTDLTANACVTNFQCVVHPDRCSPDALIDLQALWLAPCPRRFD